MSSTKKAKDYMHTNNLQNMFLNPVTPITVSNTIRKLKPKASIDIDNLSTKLLKDISDNILIPLTHIINLTLETGEVPDKMKIAKVVPVFKSGDNKILNNYRPISILPVFSKVLEKIMNEKILSFMETTHQFYSHQYGFRPKHSTIHPVIHLLNNRGK